MLEHVINAVAHIGWSALGYVIASIALDRWHDRSLRSSRKIITGILRSVANATSGNSSDYERHQQAVRVQRANRDKQP